jgi:hypothetical protein
VLFFFLARKQRWLFVSNNVYVVANIGYINDDPLVVIEMHNILTKY